MNWTFIFLWRSVGHQKSSLYSDIQGKINQTLQYWWDKPERIIGLIDHKSFVHHSTTFTCISTLVFPWECGSVFHNLWPAYCFKKKETAKYHCVLQIFVCSTGQSCCGWILSVMFTLELGSCFTLCCYSVNKMWKLGRVFLLSVNFCVLFKLSSTNIWYAL